MCVNKRWIENKYTGHNILVDCGHCPACLQKKANRKSAMIRNNYPDDGSMVALFVGLTYRDEFMPYIKVDEIQSSDSPCYVEAFVYRDYDRRYKRVKKDVYRFIHPSQRFITPSKTGRPVHYGNVWVDNRNYPIDLFFASHLHKIDRTCKEIPTKPGCVSIAYYPDAQNFIKKLYINLTRHFHYDYIQNNISYFLCSEYGSKTCRSHFHLLLFCPAQHISLIKSAIVKSWSYDDDRQLRKRIQVAKDAANYVSSYVNCNSYVPRLLRCSQFAPKSTYSHGFGQGKNVFSLKSIYDSFLQQKVVYDVTSVQNGTQVHDSLLVPQYVISRIAPKIKGYNRLTPNEIFDIYLDPKTHLRTYQRFLQYKFDPVNGINDLKRNISLIQNAKQKWFDIGLSDVDFADFCSSYYSLRQSYLQSSTHQLFDDTLLDYQYYTNFDKFITGVIPHAGLLAGIWKYPVGTSFEYDPNFFEDNMKENSRLVEKFFKYDKSRKFNGFVYND